MGEHDLSDAELLYQAGLTAELAAAWADATESGRSLAPEVVNHLKATGLLNSGLPKALGGRQAAPRTMLEAAEAVARGDASAGWCVGIATTTSLLSHYLPKDGGEEVFGDPRSAAAGVWAPTGRARLTDDGLVVSGRWSFCSGINHSEWFFGGVLVQSGSEPPVRRLVALRRSDLTILDTWYTSGLCGTGSHDVVADEVLVPASRVVSLSDGPVEDAEPLYRFPLIGFLGAAVAAAALGNARGAVDELSLLVASKKATGSSRVLAERSATQETLARAEATLRAARAFFYESVDEVWAAVLRDAPISDRVRATLRLASTHAARASAEVASSMYELGGGTAIYQTSSLQRRFRDANTVTAHFMVSPVTFELTGRILLGLDPRTDEW